MSAKYTAIMTDSSVVGHETTATSTAWCFYALSQYQDVQAKLRAELQAVPTETPTMDVLDGLPYLDAVCRETLRLFAPVRFLQRL